METMDDNEITMNAPRSKGSQRPQQQSQDRTVALGGRDSPRPPNSRVVNHTHSRRFAHAAAGINTANALKRKRTRTVVSAGEARADQLSCSLATIAREEQRARKSFRGNKKSESEESVSSFTNQESSAGGTSSSRPVAALVTASNANATTSSGEDRYSSGGNHSGGKRNESIPTNHHASQRRVQLTLESRLEPQQLNNEQHRPPCFQGHFPHHPRRHSQLPLEEPVFVADHPVKNEAPVRVTAATPEVSITDPVASTAALKPRRLRPNNNNMVEKKDGSNSASSSSDECSANDDGYNGSASAQQTDSSSSSCSSEEEGSNSSTSSPRRNKGVFTKPYRYVETADGTLKRIKRTKPADAGESSSSSFLADFSSSSISGSEAIVVVAETTSSGSASDRRSPTGCDNESANDMSPPPPTKKAPSPPQQPRSRGRGHKRRHEEEEQEPAASAPKDLTAALITGLKIGKAARRSHQSHPRYLRHQMQQQTRNNNESIIKKRAAKPTSAVGRALCVASVAPTSCTLNGISPIFSLNCDLMGCCMTYLEPPDVHALLTSPISKHWSNNFTSPQELWRTLCVTEPFKAQFEDEDIESVEGVASLHSGVAVKHMFGKYRLLYTSFVRCMRYLARIKDDAVHGRPPSVVDYGSANTSAPNVVANENLKKFLAQARDVTRTTKKQKAAKRSSSHRADGGEDHDHAPFGVSDDASSEGSVRKLVPVKKRAKTSRLGNSALTKRLLSASKKGDAGYENLPWSCAIYSIVNWMVAYSDVEGIQTMCLKVFPFLLEDEGQRTTAQRAGLTDIVLRGMVQFPDSVELHTAAFHTIVLLARPLGGKEGMLFHSSMVNSSGIFNSGSSSGRNGIAVMLDSMRRFENEAVLQAMSCWSMVNIALAPSQKTVLVKLGGIAAIANAMMHHPFNAEVQFRALFALINLVIPSVRLQEGSTEEVFLQEQLGDINDTTEREVLDEIVGEIANLVVVAMKNFCSSESILNRACLVLHNLSLTNDYHETLLWTPNFYQMLEWCLANYRTDQVLQQSAAGTLHRVQTTLSVNDELRARFTASLKSQQQTSLMQARQEALLLQQQQQELVPLPQAPEELSSNAMDVESNE